MWASGTMPSGPAALPLRAGLLPPLQDTRQRGVQSLLRLSYCLGHSGHGPPPPHQASQGWGRPRGRAGAEGAVYRLSTGPGLRDVMAGAKEGEGAGCFSGELELE